MTQWFEFSFEHMTPAQRRKCPLWARRVAVSDDGIIYVPAVVAAAEMQVFLCASYDGTAVIVDRKHLYCPADWMAREFPDSAPAIAKMRLNLAKHFPEEEFAGLPWGMWIGAAGSF